MGLVQANMDGSNYDPLAFGLNKYGMGGSGSNGRGSSMGGAIGAMGAAALGAAALGAVGNTNAQTSHMKDILNSGYIADKSQMPNTPNNNVENDNKDEGGKPKPPLIVDGTNDNVGTEIVKPMDTSFDPYAWAKAMRDEEWAREDQIRNEVWAREDDAYSRAIQDLRNSGVNINLLGNITPAGSGGGITNQTGSMDYTMSAAEYNKKMEMLMQEIENNFKGDENEKDRITGLIRSLIMGGIMLSK